MGSDVEVNDGKTPVPKANPAVGRLPQAGMIWAAVGQLVTHAFDRSSLDHRAGEGTNDAAHQGE
jgi:hypothetical protein